MNIIKSDIVPDSQDIFWEDKNLHSDGNIKKPVLVLVTDCSEGSPEELLLMKMLGPGASNLNPNQYNILKLKDGEKIAWHQLRESYDPKVILMSGVSTGQLGISAIFNLNIPNRFSECIWIPTVMLTELNQNAEVKKQLWNNGMKPVFADKNFGEI